MEWLINADWSILSWIQANLRCGILDFLMPKITLLGDVGAVWIVAALILVVTKRYRKQGILLIIGLCVGVLVGNLALKNIVARPRPCWLDTGVRLLTESPTDFSFPSGHALSSVIAATMLTFANRRFGYFAVPLAALISFSRLYLYVHFPSDILGAAVIGVIIGAAVFCAGMRLIRFVSARRRSPRGGSL